MYEKIYELIAQWENDWQNMCDREIEARKEFGNETAFHHTIQQTELRKRIGQLTDLVRD